MVKKDATVKIADINAYINERCKVFLYDCSPPKTQECSKYKREMHKARMKQSIKTLKNLKRVLNENILMKETENLRKISERLLARIEAYNKERLTKKRGGCEK